MLEIAGARLADGTIDVGGAGPAAAVVRLRDEKVERLLGTGASRVGPGPHGTVLADPDGQEFCVVHPGS